MSFDDGLVNLAGVRSRAALKIKAMLFGERLGRGVRVAWEWCKSGLGVGVPWEWHGSCMGVVRVRKCLCGLSENGMGVV